MTDFQIKLRKRGITAQELLHDIRQVALIREAGTVTRLEYDQYGQFGATTVLRNFKTWNAAVRAAGLGVVTRQDIKNEELFENFASVWTHLGKQPFGRHMSDRSTGSKFSTGTYEKRFGSWNKALIAFEEYMAGNADPDTFIKEASSVPASVTGKRTPRGVNWRLRYKVMVRDHCICKICGDSPAKNPATVLHVDHIVPWSKGGETFEENLQTLCLICNIGKSDIVV
ncbi:HNH endonuclease [Sandarakinorhabdus sp.]|uniref:homing endonuclease associated repeat-containing protein n=1 Tax=Sandarakinorhabdus sp. TaxID=1916663 RepID=UPI00334031BA